MFGMICIVSIVLDLAHDSISNLSIVMGVNVFATHEDFLYHDVV